MERLIKDGDIILDGTLTRYEAEKQAFEKLERLEEIMSKYNVKSIEVLDFIVQQYCLLAKAIIQLKDILDGKDKSKE